MDGNDNFGDISTRSIERVKSGLKASEDEMTDAEVNEEEETEDEEMEDEDSSDNRIDPKLAFIDQQIELHLTRYVQRRISDLQMLRIRSQGDEYIPPSLTDEQLIVYLFAMHYNIARTLSLLRSNYKLRTKIPSFFTSRSVTETSIQDVWNVLKVGVFPKKTNTHQHIVYIGLRSHDPERFKVHAVLKLFLMCMDVYHILEGLPCCIIAILDGAGASYGYFTRENYEHLKIVVKYVQESMPYNVEQIHVVNTTLTIKTVFKLLKPFLTKDIISAMHFHADNDLKKFIPPRCLPAEYGGTAPGSIDEYQANFRQRLEMLQEFFDMEEEQRATYYFPKENTA
uniref:Alpha-tocopherol transfer protein-like protein n=1 Tax=Lygus hesperus TaxID=30085 RepID=A0A0A9W3W0_LYGHE